MVEVLFYVKEVENVSSLDLMNLKKVLKVSLVEVKHKVKSKSVLVRYPLYYNDHEEIAQKVLSLFQTLSKMALCFGVYEIVEEFSEFKEGEYSNCELNRDELNNLLEF